MSGSGPDLVTPPGPGQGGGPPTGAFLDPVAAWAHIGLAALAAVSTLRYSVRHGLADLTPAVITLAAAMLAADLLAARAVSARPRLAWLLTVGGAWLVLVGAAPSFVWCAVPLLLVFLRTMPGGAAAVASVVIAGAAIVALMRLSTRFDPSAIAGPIVLAGLLAVTHRALTRETAAHAEVISHLTATRQRLADQERAAGVLAERQRLAGEVHDSIAQGISSVLMLAQAAERELDRDPAAARHHITQAVSQARHDLDEVRHIVHALSPPALDGAPLAGALAALCRRQSAAAGVAVNFTVVDAPAVTSTSEDAVLLRIAQESIANAVRHAGASRIDVTVSYLPGHVTLDVVDDGCGFDPAAVPGRSGRAGYGLQTMAARAAEVGGRLDIESGPGAGTAVTVTIPLGDGHRAGAAPAGDGDGRPAAGDGAGEPVGARDGAGA
ncbi:MAG: sensor histidine kinase [Acidimicrobiales bacterium]